MRNKNFPLLILVIVLAIIVALFVYPKNNIGSFNLGPAALGSKFLPWRLGLDVVGGTRLVYDIDVSGLASGDKPSVLNGLRDIMEARVNAFGVSEPNVVLSQTSGKNYIIVELAGIKDPATAIAQIGRTAFLQFAEVDQKEVDGKTEVNYIPTALTGRYLTKAQLTTDQVGQPQVALSFNSDGGNLFSDITGKNIGKPLAILIDNQLVSAPRVNERISGGSAVITGVSAKEGKALVNLLNAGALPAPVTLASQSTIGATLGSQFLNRALLAGALGTLLVILFISIYYRSLGIFASLALIFYIILTLGIFKSVSITMSLSGIAGFILSIGMAVDANVLIFERTKEEIKKGLLRTSAIEEGFRRAWPSIRDSNISTIITAIILYFFTSSFVQGFALTLLVGVLVSMLSAITLTRLILRTFVK